MARPKVKSFDFSRLPKLSKKQVVITNALMAQYPQLETFHEDPMSLAKAVQKEFNLPLKIEFAGLAEQSYGEFIETMASPCLSLELEIEPNGDKVIVEIDQPLLRPLLNHLMGGHVATTLTEKTPIEQGLLEFFFLRILMNLKDAISTLGHRRFRLIKLVEEPKVLIDNNLEKQAGCIFKFFLGLGNYQGYARVFFPHPLVEGLFLREDVLRGVGTSDIDWERQIERVNHVRTEAWSEVGRMSLKASEKELLEKGDVILFDESSANMGPHGVAGKAVIRVGKNLSQGLWCEIIDTEGKIVLKVLDFIGGSS